MDLESRSAGNSETLGLALAEALNWAVRGRISFPQRNISENYTLVLNKVVFTAVYSFPWASLIAQLIKNPPAMRETWVQFPGWKDPLEKGMALPIPVFLPGEFHGLYSRPWGHKVSNTTERLSLHFILLERNLNIASESSD